MRGGDMRKKKICAACGFPDSKPTHRHNLPDNETQYIGKQKLRPSLSWGDALQFIMEQEKELAEARAVIEELMDRVKDSTHQFDGIEDLRKRAEKWLGRKV
jgi:hypothetical protein